MNSFLIYVSWTCMGQCSWDTEKTIHCFAYYSNLTEHPEFYLVTLHQAPHSTWRAEDLFQVSLTSLLRNSWKPWRIRYFLLHEFCCSALFKNICTTFCTHFSLGSRQTSTPLTSLTMISEWSQCGPLSITLSSLIYLGWKGVECVFMHWHRSSVLILDRTAASHTAAESRKAAKRATASLEVMFSRSIFSLVSYWLLS